MRTKQSLASLALLLVAPSLMPVLPADAAAPASADAPSANAILRQMSDKLGAARNFSFKVTREIDSGQDGGDGLPAKAEIAVVVQRPDKVVARATSPGDVRHLYADGKHLSLFDAQKKFYETVPMAASLDELPAKLASIYGFTPPLAEFLISDIYKDIVFRAKDISYAGTGNIKTGFLGLKTVPCHRILLSGTAADSELWIAVSDLLPRRWTATVKGPNGNVGITLDFSHWNLDANTTERDFVFLPPEGAARIPMRTVAEMEAAHKAGK